MNPRHSVWIAFMIMLILGAITPIVSMALSDPTAVVYVEPSVNMFSPGQSFTIKVNIRNVENLNVYDIKLAYDTEVLYTDKTLIREGSFLRDKARSAGYSTMFNKYIGSFYIQFGCYITGPVGASGNGTLATVTFSVQKNGASPLHLFDVKLYDPYYDGKPTYPQIPHTEEDGFFTNTINVAVIDVSVSSTQISKGEPLYINATVINESNTTETFNVAAYYDSTLIGIQNVTNLNTGDSLTQSFTWNTINVAPGTYTIKANASIVEGETDTADNELIYGQVMVTLAPKASFTFSPSPPIIGEPVTLNASASFAPNGYIANYTWAFGDGGTGSGVIVNHTYTEIGWYTVTLNVTDNVGMWDTELKLIKVVKAPPEALFSFSPLQPMIGEVVTFNASDSVAPNGFIVSYAWAFGDGGTGNVKIVNHTYTAIGTYNVTLDIIDNMGMTDTESKSIKVVEAPVAAFTYSPTVPLINQAITFNATSSTPNGGSIVSYAWNFGDGGTGSGQIVTYTYTSFGTHMVTLNVTDNEGLWDTESKSIVVKSPPEASFEFTPSRPAVNEMVTFNASASRDADGTIANYKWDFGDGNVTTVSGSTITHVYAVAKSYTVTLAVTDNDGFTNVQSKNVPVEEAPQTNFLLYVGVAVIIVIAATLLFYFSRRKR